FYSGQLVSQLGTWMRSAALGWIALERTGSEFWLGMVAVATNLPMLVVTPWAGSLADQFPRLAIFRATSTLALVASSTLAILLFMHALPTPLIYILAMLWGLATAFEMPARQAMIVELAGRKNLVNAIALNSASVNGTRAIGPALGGILLASAGAAWCFVADAFSYLVVLTSTLFLRMPPTLTRPRKGSASAHLVEGARYTWGDPPLRWAMLNLLCMSLFGWAYLSQMAAMAKIGLGLGATGYGLLLASSGVGALASALVVAACGGRRGLVRQMLVGVVVYALSLALATLPRNPWAAGAGFVGSGFGLILFLASCNSMVQMRVRDLFRGRVMGLYGLLFGGGMPLGSLWLAVAADVWGVRWALRLSAVLAVLSVTGVWFMAGGRKVLHAPDEAGSIAWSERETVG
ncbi:MAG: MFS transporter, partial [bacterium]